MIKLTLDGTRKKFVIWSGGYDSTYLLYKMASEYSTKENPITSLYIKHNAIEARKQDIEIEQRKKILDVLRNKHNLHIERSCYCDRSARWKR